MNILWICTDQQRMDTLGCYGNTLVHTPNLDRLSSLGVRFTNTYSQCPVCAPSRGSFLTGRYPRTCGVRQNGQDIDDRAVLLPRLLKEHGYFCGLSGKLHLSSCHDSVCKTMERRIDDGYDYFKWSHHPAPFQGTNWPMNEYSMWLAGQGMDYITPDRKDCRFVQNGMPEEYHQTTWCTNQALQFMESAERYGRPWFFSLNYFDPHHPFDPPEEYLEPYLDRLSDIPLPDYEQGEYKNKPVFQEIDHNGAYDTPGLFAYDDMSEYDHRMIRAAYYAMIDLIDHQVGRLLQWLEEKNRLQDTMIIFTSDHGENLGDHGMYLKGPYFYECNVHVPLIVAYPGTIPGGRTCETLAELTDLAETICDASGIPQYEGMQGRSLWNLLCSGDIQEHRKSVYSEYYNCNINHRNPLAFATMVFDGRYKLVRVHDRDGIQKCTGELYDLQEDPGEHKNLYDRPEWITEKVRMMEMLADRMAETSDPLPQRKAFW